MSSSKSAPWSLSDATLAQSAAAEPVEEDARWFAKEVLPYEASLRAYLRQCFPTIRDTNNIMQETHARLFREHQAGKVFETPSHLFRVARNAAIDVFRRNRAIAIDGLGEVAALGVLEEKPDAAESASQTQELELLREAIGLLPAQCQEIFSLHRCQGLTQRQVAEKLGISQNLVHTQLCHAIFRCRQYLASRGITRGRLQEMSELFIGRINADATRAG